MAEDNNKTKKRVTMKEVAQKAGVTIGTVSHVLNGTAPISEKTTLRVRQVITELDYIPNFMAKNMRTKENRILGIMVPKLTNNFYSRIASVIMNEADKENYTVMLLSYEYSLKKEIKEMNSLVQNNVGTIILANGYDDEEYIKDLLNRGVHVILADRKSTIENVPCVEYDNYDIMIEVIALLKQKGYRTIGLITEPLTLTNLNVRFEGYKKGLKEYGYEFNEKHVFVSEEFRKDHLKNGYLYMNDLLKNNRKEDLPEVFIASSDLIAIGILNAIRENGYSVPGDFGVIGCDDIEMANYTYPALTTICQDREKLAKELWQMVMANRMGKKIENVKIGQKLIVRDSC